MIYAPRDYQQRAIDAGIDNLFGNKIATNGLLLLPTGTGKSVVIGGTVRKIKELYPPARIVMLTHVKELVEQNYEKAVAMTGLNIGLWSAGLRRKEYDSDIVFAGIDTVARNPHLLGRRDVCLIDEAHRVAPNPNTTYRTVLEQRLRKYNPHIMSLGYTATDHRLGQGLLTDPWYYKKTETTYQPFWDNVLLDLTSPDEFLKFFDQGYLKRIVPMSTDSEIDVSGMRKQGGEFVQADVANAVNNARKVTEIVDEICTAGFDRRSWLVFGSGNQNAEMLAAEISARGVSVALITDSTPAAERARLIAAYKNYEIRCLVNNDILTTGFDHAGVDLIAVVRVTESTALWVQMLGRGTRPVYAQGFDLSTQDGRLASIFASGVYNCIVLDFAGNSKRLGTINNPVKPTRPEEKRQSASMTPCKLCKSCGAYNSTTARICENELCRAEFLLSEELVTEAGTDALIDETTHVPDRRKLRVTSVRYEKVSRPKNGLIIETITAHYKCAKHGTFRDTLTFNGEKSTKRMQAWWRSFGDGAPVPYSNDAFLDNYAHSGRLRTLSVIEVYMNPPRKAKPEVVYYGFDDKSFFEDEQVYDEQGQDQFS